VKKLLLLSCMALLVVGSSAGAQEDPEELGRRMAYEESGDNGRAAKEIRRLERRVQSLERELEAKEESSGRASASASSSDLERRVEKLEKEMEDWGAGDTLRAYWDEGLEWDSNDGRFHLEFGGRIMTDFAFWTSEDDDVEAVVGEPLDDYIEFRRARLFTSGKLYSGTATYKAQYDFGGGDADFKDVKIGFPKLLGGFSGVTVGHQKEPFSLEELTSSKYITFMERGAPHAFSPGRNTGFKFGNAVLNERVTWAAGLFDDTDGFGEDMGDGDWASTARLTAAPLYADDGARVVHLGVAGSLRSNDGDEAGFDRVPELHDAPDFVDTGDIMADQTTLLGLEGALVYGPFSLQSEWMQADLDTEDSEMYFDDPTFDGWYVFASYFLTGEHRPYDTGDGAFGRVKPKNNAFEDGGLGAWELGLRLSNIDLTDGLIIPESDPFDPFDGEEEAKTPGELDNVTVGLNWYLNPNTRVMFNYVVADLERGDVDDDVSAFMTRFQIDF